MAMADVTLKHFYVGRKPALMNNLWKKSADNAWTTEISNTVLEHNEHKSLPDKNTMPLPDVRQLSLYNGDDEAPIMDCLTLPSVANLKRIAGWHSWFPVPPVSMHVSLQNGESHVAMCRAVISNGSFASICPWSGVGISTVNSFVVESRPYDVPLYAYRFETKEVFYVLVLGSAGCSMAGVFFPRSQIFVSFDKNKDDKGAEKYAIPLRDFLFRNAPDVLAYIAREQTCCAVLVSSYHFAHHVWNEISAIDDLAESCREALHVWVIKSPFGPLDLLYPELRPDQISNCTGMKFEAVALKAMRAGIFWAPLGRSFIPQDVPQRILSVARELHPQDCNFSAHVRKGAAFILWVSVRTDTRVCLNQATIIAEAISVSFHKFGSIAVIFDGHTPGYGGHMSSEVQDAEDKIVNDICRLTTVPFIGISLIGASLLQAVVWGSICDFYIANHGTIQHKIGWLHDKPGICHYFSKPGFALRNFGAVYAREKCVTPKYFFGDSIAQDGKASDLRQDLFSYIIDLKQFIAVYEDALSVFDMNSDSLPATERTFLRLREDPYEVELSHQYLAMGDSCWQKHDMAGAISSFAKAWSMAPKHPTAMNRMIEFCLMNFVSWRGGADNTVMRILALRLVLLTNQTNHWARYQMCKELLNMRDKIDLVSACIELNSQVPDFVNEFVKYAEENLMPIPAGLVAEINSLAVHS